MRVVLQFSREGSGMRKKRQFAFICAALGAACITTSTFALDYAIERIASGLAQPTYMTQAPGDPSNIIYYSTRITAPTGTGGGFGTINQMGSIWRYDTTTRTSTQIMNLSYRQLTGDEGLESFAFSPDFNIPGAPGYQKLYVVSSTYNGGTVSPIERVEEYTANGPNGTVPVDASGHPIVSRTILQYTNVNSQPNHTVDWVGFDPTAASLPVGSPARNYMFITTGDGDIGGAAQTRPEQKANDDRGKVLRVNVDPTAPDAYPSDPNKNFAIPATNPIPLWNAAHPNQQLASTTLNYTTSPTSVTYGSALPEIYLTGTRNTYRMSIDSATGDIWMGDVGENSREEINFLKAGTYNGTQPPIDFGYASREGTIATNAGLAVSGSSGATTLQWNLSDGSSMTINSTNPVEEGTHNAGRSAYIGGYVYRGPIASLQGDYFYADFVNSNEFQVSNFNRNIPLSSYSGTNFNLNASGVAQLGTVTAVGTASASSLWNSIIFDPTDPTYTAANDGAQFGIGRVVSFGQDNSGNLYVIDMGGNRGDNSFGQDYPNAGTGEIFELVPVPEPLSAMSLLPLGLLLLRRRAKSA